MTTHLTGVLVRGASFGVGGARACSERAVSEENFDSSNFSGKCRSKTPEITIFGEKCLEKCLVKNAWSSATTHSTDTSTILGSIV
jgi:hypothetical protein